MKQSTFEKNTFYERLIVLRRRDRKTFEGMSPATKYALAEYESRKRQAEQEAEARGNGPIAA